MTIRGLTYWANKHLLLGMILSLLPILLLAQTDLIQLNNPSFEDYPKAGFTPKNWYDCGSINFPYESPPDIHPSPIPQFGVTTLPQDGNTYIGLVVRDNETWESVSQRLSTPLIPGNCYNFSLFLARSANYTSAVGDRENNASNEKRDPNTIVNHNTPTILRIWGGNGYCKQKEKLGSTKKPIEHEIWVEYQFKFEPTTRLSHITLEAFFKEPSLFPYNGNLLIDNLSAIKVIPCQEEPPVLSFSRPSKNNQKVAAASYTFRLDTKNIFNRNQLTVQLNNKVITEFKFDSNTGGISLVSQLRKGRNIIVVNSKNSVGTAREQRSVIYEEKTIAAVTEKPREIVQSRPSTTESTLLKRSDLRPGRTIRIDKLYFPADSATIKRESYGALEDIFDFLRQNGDVKVEIGGHTNNVPPPEYCFRLSNDRAKAVVDYLVRRGIGEERLKYKGYGKTKPVVANKTKEGRRKNQRVEIKILSYNG